MGVSKIETTIRTLNRRIASQLLQKQTPKNEVKLKMAKLGSLFDGSGGFPLAGALFRIEPVWASEIEPFPIRVTKQRFPGMKHLGSVTEVHGDQVEPVDIITFGSPCQDLSIAGKQLGIHGGERSSLFFEAIRIIKEMRKHDRDIGRSGIDIRPRFAVWENVPGAFSSNRGDDFRAVLQAFCDVSEEGGITVPQPQGGRWKSAGCIVGNGWSVAWRVYDAQYWGVPQRRKRIYLVADFGSERAGQILFEQESLSWNSEEIAKAEENASRYIDRSVDGSGWQWLSGEQHTGATFYEISAGTIRKGDEICQTLRSRMGTGGGNVPLDRKSVV